MKGRLDIMDLIDKIVEKDPRYKAEAYLFLMSALNFTVNKLEEQRHITGQELSNGIKDYAIEQFGPMARMVLEHWGIYRTDDFGNIVYNLIDAKLLAKTESDSIDDFKGVYEFKEAFDKPSYYRLSSD